MNLTDRLKQVYQTLEKCGLKYALAGGLISSIYRSHERMTNDVDLLLLISDLSEGEKLLESWNLVPQKVRQAELEGGPKHAIKNKSTPVLMLCGRTPPDKAEIRVDFILPLMPWFEGALDRAQHNRIEFPFGKIPCITVEDLIVAKLYALRNRSDRFKDLDDLKNIFEADKEIDIPYLISTIEEHKLKIPNVLKDSAPKLLRRFLSKW